MRFLKRTIQWTFGIICGLYLSLQVALHIPSVQEWVGATAASVINDLLGWDISIGRIKLGLWNRVIIDNIYLKDKNDSTLLHASRLAAKIDILPLTEGRISIANAQLFGTQIYAYQSSPNSAPNFKFVIDSFSSNDTTSKPIDLHIGTVLFRRVELRWDQQWKEKKENGIFDPAHIQIKDIALTAHLKVLKQDSINLNIKRFSFSESNGLILKNLSFALEAGKHGGHLKDFKLQLPNSIFSIPSVRSAWPYIPNKYNINKWLYALSWSSEASIHFTPSDICAVLPRLKEANDPLSLDLTAFGSEGCINVSHLDITNKKSLQLNTRLFIRDFPQNPETTINIDKFQINAKLQQYVTKTLNGVEQEISPILTRLDTINITGRLQFTKHKQNCLLKIANHAANIHLNANARDWNQFNGSIISPGIELNKLLSDNNVHPLGRVSLDAKIKGMVKDIKGKTKIELNTAIPEFNIKERKYRDSKIQAELDGTKLSVSTNLQDEGGCIMTRLSWNRGKSNHIAGLINVDRIASESLHISHKYPRTRFSGDVDIDVTYSDIDDIIGELNLHNLAMESLDSTSFIVSPWNLSVSTDINKNKIRTIKIDSDILDLYASGQFRLSTLATTLQNTIHEKLPNIIPYKNISSKADTIEFSLNLKDTTILRHIARSNISIPQLSSFNGKVYGYDSIYIQGTIPDLHIGNEHVRNSMLNIKGTQKLMTLNIATERRQKNGYVAMSIKASAHENRLRVIAGLDNQQTPSFKGEMDITTNFVKAEDGKKEVRAWIAPTELVVSDTLWRIHPASIVWKDKTLSIQDFRISQSSEHGLDINGRLSEDMDDTLTLNLQRINVEYVLDMVNFRAVEFSGLASGTAKATGILSNPIANAQLEVENFRFNQAPLGTLRADANWGDKVNFLTLDATISDLTSQHHTEVKGGFHIGSKEVPDGLDLRVNTKRFNLAFMNHFTKDILENFQGRASGYCRIFGPFSGIDLEGGLMIDHANCKLPMLGASYQLRQDSVHLKPGEITINALLTDKHAVPIARPFTDYSFSKPHTIPHTAILHGRLRHKNFNELTYSFNVRANRFLGYDFKEFGENSFYATCYASGNISVNGGPGQLVVDIDATPEAGTTFTYNVTTPDALTEAGFITIRDGERTNKTNPSVFVSNDSTVSGLQQVATTKATTVEDEEENTSDLYLRFNLQVTPDAKLRLLMDRKSGDNIEIKGNGRIMARYHNKGRFNIYGTYRVQDGCYHLSLQDIIRKDFKFQPDGTIVFGGDAMKADLNLKAVYSVHGVSLDDLTTTSLGFSKTRVDCIMNLTGNPEQPSVTFDFDLPEATEDERQMVRSIVSTEEERNMQAIYLLGLGRFFSFETESSTQSTAAINSLVSTTLSSQVNQFISNAVGGGNWNFGTNLKTGDDGWRNVDVEGMLSGSLFNDRLLLSGNFGYREKYYTQRNFISDVSVEYLLTKKGTISLKAYNQGNDRYFVQSSLNTQGIGIQFKKDFNRFTDLFHWIIPRKSE